MASRVGACRICQSTDLQDVLSLGDMPAVNSFLASEAEIAGEKRHPLAIVFCPTCTHVQLTHMLDPRDVFSDYIYFSSMSETVVRWGQTLAARYAAELSLGKDDLVGELASNDGCILKPFQAHCRVYGVEPAKNIAAAANADGVPTLAEFFDSKTAVRVREQQGRAKLIIARNVVAHVPELVDFIAGAREWLADDGVLHIEVPYLREMVEKLEFDTIYHEHLSYFTVGALERLMREAGLVLWDVEQIALHGGSLVVRARKPGSPRSASTANVTRLLAAESNDGFHTIAPLVKFAEGTRRLKDAIPTALRELRASGKSLAAYGAAAKGVVLTNYCEIGRDLLGFVADRSPHKQGKLMPGVHLPVVAPDRVLSDHPDVVLLLAWNFADEIRKQLAAHEAGGRRFMVPIPKPQLL